VAMRTGPLEAKINRYKYEAKTGWARIFGRVLAGFLESERSTFGWFNLIISSPTFVGEGGRTFDHTQRVLYFAGSEGEYVYKRVATAPLQGSQWPPAARTPAPPVSSALRHGAD
jgi:predicted amidophosphoribosyltransferase